MKTQVDGADMIIMGHVHEDHELSYQVEYLDRENNVKTKRVLMVRTATYKDEFNDGAHGWHNMNGRPPKPLGGRFIHFESKHIMDGDQLFVHTEPTVKR
jgi:hypothetical protein